MSDTLFNLDGKTALITGGAGLLAREHAIALASHGARVVLSDLSIEALTPIVEDLKSEGYDVEGKTLNVTEPEAWNGICDEVVGSHGSLDILVNNAGFTNQSKIEGFGDSAEDFPLEAWNAIMNVNLTGSFLGCQAAGKQMLKQGKGSIINIASLYGVVSPNHRIYDDTPISQPIAYSVSKHGVVAMTKYLATLWAEKGVRVNALTPGGIFNGHTDPFLKRFKKLNPIGRMSEKDELRGGIVYLASDASSHVVGHNLVIDGGWTAW